MLQGCWRTRVNHRSINMSINLCKSLQANSGLIRRLAPNKRINTNQRRSCQSLTMTPSKKSRFAREPADQHQTIVPILLKIASKNAVNQCTLQRSHCRIAENETQGLNVHCPLQLLEKMQTLYKIQLQTQHSRRKACSIRLSQAETLRDIETNPSWFCLLQLASWHAQQDLIHLGSCWVRSKGMTNPWGRTSMTPCRGFWGVCSGQKLIKVNHPSSLTAKRLWSGILLSWSYGRLWFQALSASSSSRLHLLLSLL